MIWKRLSYVFDILTDELFGRLCESSHFCQAAEDITDKELAGLKADWHIIMATRIVPFVGDIKQSCEIAAAQKPRFHYIDYYSWWQDPLRIMRVVCGLFGIKYIRIKDADDFSHAFILAFVRGLL